MQAKGQDIVSVIELGAIPGIVLVVAKDKAEKIQGHQDLKGAKIGVTAPGSSTNFFVNFLLAKNGLKPMMSPSWAWAAVLPPWRR